ncbi:MAG: hypothetical protein ACREP2_12195 [Rhodanobacteraceae bacterium]
MSSDRYEGPSPQRSSKIPAWLIVMLSILLVLGLCCIGFLAFMFIGIRSVVHRVGAEEVQASMAELQSEIATYKSDYSLYPPSLSLALSSAGGVPNQGISTVDSRDPAGTPLIYLLPADNALPGDILIHTSIHGPLPILAETIDGNLLEFKSIGAFKAALRPQEDRLLAPAAPVAPPAPSPPAVPAVPTGAAGGAP